MEIKIGDRVYEVDDNCPVDSPRRSTLLRHLRDHGPESLLTSKKTSPYAACVWDKLEESGAQLVEPNEHSETPQEEAAFPDNFDMCEINPPTETVEE